MFVSLCLRGTVGSEFGCVSVDACSWMCVSGCVFGMCALMGVLFMCVFRLGFWIRVLGCVFFDVWSWTCFFGYVFWIGF